MDFPKIKPKIKAFLLKEDGKISKKSILKAGIIAGALALSGQLARAEHTNYDYIKHNNDLSLIKENPKAYSDHQHHTYHVSHDDHNSY